MKPITLFSQIIVLLLCSISGPAQTATGSQSQWRITEKEVVAVQVELKRLGYYKDKLSGVLDQYTRQVVRRYQSENGLKVNGRIDRPTYEKLGLPYPATGKERDSQRPDGVLSSIGYGIKDKTVAVGQAVGGAASKVKGGTMTGYEKTRDTGSGAVSKTKEMAQGVGGATAKGVRTIGRGPNRATDAIVGRSDDDIQGEVRQLLNKNKETERWYCEVRSGLVTIRVPSQHQGDIGTVISNVRKISGVKSVFVVVK